MTMVKVLGSLAQRIQVPTSCAKCALRCLVIAHTVLEMPTEQFKPLT